MGAQRGAAGGRSRPVPLRRRLRYAFDNTLSAGSGAMVAWLALLSVALVVTAALAIVVTDVRQLGDPSPLGFVEAAWESLMRTLDPGTMGNDTGWGFRLVMLAVTVGGILVVATLIGVLASGIEGRLADLRKGRSVVVESGHTLILGWSPEIFGMILELAHAKAHEHRPRVVVVAQRDKVAMEDEIRTVLGDDVEPLKVVCRTGSPLSPHDIALGNPDEARAIIILTPPGPEGDAQVIKTLLALVNNPDRQPRPYHIVAELHDPRDLRLAAIVGGSEAELIATDTVLAHITAQTCRQPGLSAVYTELLDFSGDELYFAPAGALAGRPFADALLYDDKTSPVGLRHADGSVELAPPLAKVVAVGDEILAIAGDRRSLFAEPLSPAPVDVDLLVHGETAPFGPEHTLVLNWNARGPLMVRELDETVPAGSSLHVVALNEDARQVVEELNVGGCRQHITFDSADPTDRDVLEPLIMGRPFQRVVILAWADASTQDSDTRALMSLLHVRDIMSRCGRRMNIVTEILDHENRELARVTAADDFIVSEEVISRLVTQVAQNAALHGVLTALFAADVHIELHPAQDYVTLGRDVHYGTVVEAARRRDQIAIGYRILQDASRPERDHGITVNPAKTARVSFAAGDRVITLAPHAS